VATRFCFEDLRGLAYRAPAILCSQHVRSQAGERPRMGRRTGAVYFCAFSSELGHSPVAEDVGDGRLAAITAAAFWATRHL